METYAMNFTIDSSRNHSFAPNIVSFSLLEPTPSGVKNLLQKVTDGFH
jgi:hypothetical protein